MRYVVRCFSGSTRFTSRPMPEKKARRIAANIATLIARRAATMEGEKIDRVVVLAESQDFINTLALS